MHFWFRLTEASGLLEQEKDLSSKYSKEKGKLDYVSKFRIPQCGYQITFSLALEQNASSADTL